ncbi:cytochrome c oxidase subunit 7B, mitochondrial-like [Symphalangus syndactylus]|nr:cytochrome c oxidase subunit 7B, mitochondrial-like [Symphalangus syndactylus]
MFPLVKNALNRLQVRSIQQTMARQSHQKRTPDFHDKYGNAVLASGATFCIVTWTYVATQVGIEWNLSPVGRVTPKEWRNQYYHPSWCNNELFKKQLIIDAKLKHCVLIKIWHY